MTAASRTPRVRETPEVAAAAGRMLRAVGTRAAWDVEALPLLAGLVREADAQLARAVTVARAEHGYSWAEVGRVLGVSRQAAQQRFGGSPVGTGAN